MKTGMYAEFCLALLIALTSLLNATAQSARVNEAPQPTPAPTQPERSAVNPSSRIDPNADRYRLVFPTYYDGVLRKGELYYVGAESDRARPSVNNSFIEQLNKAGQEGYRLRSVTGAFPIAIVELDEAPHEYAWFETTGPMSVKEGFLGTYSRLSKQGFSLFANLMVGRDCEEINLIDSVPLETCTYTDFFLLEKLQGVVKTREHMLAFTGPASHRETGPELTAEIKEKLTLGFYPTNVLSRFEILLERTENNQQISNRERDVRVVTSGWRDDVEKKIDELAKQGYRLALINNGIAVMYRDPGAATPLSYIWLDAKKKDFAKQLARLQAQGTIYRMTYPTGEGVESKLVFEQSAVGDGMRREYKVLKFEFQFVPNAAEKKVHKDLTPASKETIKLMNTLAREGFVVRDLFISDQVSVLLERSLRESERRGMAIKHSRGKTNAK